MSDRPPLAPATARAIRPGIDIDYGSLQKVQPVALRQLCLFCDKSHAATSPTTSLDPPAFADCQGLAAIGAHIVIVGPLPSCALRCHLRAHHYECGRTRRDSRWIWL
jgi:hypothetical protein